MARSKQNKNQSNKVDGKYRQETREERRLRLKQQEEAREQCMKLLPQVGGGVLIFFIVFAIYVRSVPPVTTPKPQEQPQFQGGMPAFMNVDTEPMVQEALSDAKEALKEAQEKEAVSEPAEPTTDETIEL